MSERRALYERLTAPGGEFELTTNALGLLVFRHAPRTLTAVWQAARSPLPYVCYEETTLTFDDVYQRGCSVAHSLVARFGVRPGYRVAVSMRNRPEYFVSVCAIHLAGAVAVLCNAMWAAPELAYALRDSGAVVLIADGERAAHAHSEAVPVPVVEVDAGWDALLAGAPAPAAPGPVTWGPEDNAILLYTSGSTGHPKGVMCTHHNVLHALEVRALGARMEELLAGVPATAGGGGGGVSLLGVPLFHVMGCHLLMLLSLRTRTKVVMMHKWDPMRAVQLIRAHGVQTFYAPPTMTGDLARALVGNPCPSLVSVGGGGSLRTPEQVRALHALGLVTSIGWGMTETNVLGTAHSGASYVERPTSCGVASPTLELRIVADDGRVVGPRERGELQARGASVIRSYWRRPDADAQCFTHDGWLRTGDLAEVDHEGYFFIVGRIKELIIRGGENVGVGAVENALEQHPNVVEAVAYGMPDARLGEEVAATLFVRDPMTREAMDDWLRHRVASFERPRHIFFSAHPLPRLASGKVHKQRVRQDAMAALAKAKL